MTPFDFTPPCGTNINSALSLALGEAVEKQCPVVLHFNDLAIPVEPTDRPAELADRYQRLCEESYARWRASPKGQAALAELERTRTAKLTANTELCDALPLVLRKDSLGDLLIPWLRKLEEASSSEVEVDYPAMARAIINAGWHPNAWVGHKPPADKNAMARYIVGQCLSCMLVSMPPHQVVHRFAEQWAKM